MKKIYFLLTVFLATFSNMMAQSGNLIFTVPEVAVEYQITALSANGKWACGNINDGNYRAFLWNLTSGEVIETSAPGDISIALGIDDSGTIVGTFTTTENTPNNAPVETYGYYKNGKWFALPLTNADGTISIISDGFANAISPNGRYIGGIANYGGDYVPVAWIDGELQIVENATGAVYDISSDGKTVCGWTLHPKKNNRTCAIWTTKNELFDTKIFTDTISAYSAGPFCVARKISPNCKYVAAYDRIYQMETGESIEVDLSNAEGGFEFYGVTNSGNMYGYVNSGTMNKGAWYTLDGKWIDVRSYLIEKGVNMDKYPYVYSLTNISEDENTFGMIAFDDQNAPRSIVVKLNVDTLNLAPVALKTRLLDGINAVRLNWNAPLRNAQKVKGYNLYRDGKKVNTSILTQTTCIDESLAPGTYNYTVTAVYDNKESELSEAVTLDVPAATPMSPRNFIALQTSVNDVRVLWDAPLSNKSSYDYISTDDYIVGFGGGTFSFESAVKFRNEELALYKKGGYKITEISFVPLSTQTSWTVNFYVEGSETPIHTEIIPSNSLNYGVENRYTLSKPIDIPEGKDVTMGIAVDVTNYGGYKILGVVYREADSGYSDLLRQAGQENFFSMHEAGLTSEGGAYECNVCWAMGMLLSKESSDNNISLKEYKLYIDGTELATTDALKYRHANVADGEHLYELQAIYSDNKISNKVSCNLKVSKNLSIFKGVLPTIEINGDQLKAAWETPIDNDESYISFANDENTGGVIGSEDSQFSYMVATEYSGSKLRTFEDYYITGFRFYPLADADFTFMLLENGEEIANLPVDRGTGYVNGKWNVVKLENPIPVNRYSQYQLILDCYDVTPYQAPIGMDSQKSYPGVSDLYSVDDGETFLSLSAQGGKDANWMIGLVAESSEKKELPINGYKVYLDNNVQHDDLIKETEYMLNNLTKGPHSLRVNPVYDNEVGEKRSSSVTFMIDLVGIKDILNNEIEIEYGVGVIKVNGDTVKSVKAHDLTGKLVAKSSSAELNVETLTKGIYVLSIQTDSKEYNLKICLQ